MLQVISLHSQPELEQVAQQHQLQAVLQQQEQVQVQLTLKDPQALLQLHLELRLTLLQVPLVRTLMEQVLVTLLDRVFRIQLVMVQVLRLHSLKEPTAQQDHQLWLVLQPRLLMPLQEELVQVLELL
jgi:hypothetical protein